MKSAGKENKGKVLVVDDEAVVRDILKRTLDDEGYECAAMPDAVQALEMLNGFKADLVITDIMMPGMSGVALLEEIVDSWPDTAVIMVTAVSDTQTAIDAMKMGASDYVTKPFNLVEVVMSVERALEKRRLLLTNREYRFELEQKVEQQTDEIRLTFLGAVKSLAEALEAKDPYTHGHSRRVTEVAVTMAAEMGLSEQEIENIRLAGLVHDIGKIGIPERILHKAEKLSEEEFALVKQHPTIGVRILKPVIRSEKVISVVRHHHERYSGGGYPDGIARDEIPLGSRLMSVADAFDAMTSTRPYRQALSMEDSKRQLLANRGSQFDPDAVDSFMSSEEKLPFCPISAKPPAKAHQKS